MDEGHPDPLDLWYLAQVFRHADVIPGKFTKETIDNFRRCAAAGLLGLSLERDMTNPSPPTESA